VWVASAFGKGTNFAAGWEALTAAFLWQYKVANVVPIAQVTFEQQTMTTIGNDRLGFNHDCNVNAVDYNNIF
jgi:hypothetical protein